MKKLICSECDCLATKIMIISFKEFANRRVLLKRAFCTPHSDMIFVMTEYIPK